MLIGGTGTAAHALSAATPLPCCGGALFCSLPPTPYRPRDCRASKQSDDPPLRFMRLPPVRRSADGTCGPKEDQAPRPAAVQSRLRDISRARELAWTHHDGTHASHHNGADRRAEKCDAPQYWKAVTSGLGPARREWRAPTTGMAIRLSSRVTILTLAPPARSAAARLLPAWASRRCRRSGCT